MLGQTGAPPAVLLATGSEVALAMQTAQILVNENIFLRTVSIPCFTRFEAQDGPYRASVLPLGLPIVTLEAGATIGLDRCGESGPCKALFEAFGVTPTCVAARIRVLLGGHLNERS